MVTKRDILQQIQYIFDSLLLEKGFLSERLGSYTYVTNNVSYEFFVGIGADYYPSSFLLGTGWFISINYVNTILNTILKQVDQNHVEIKITCGTGPNYFKRVVQPYYEITSLASLEYTLNEINILFTEHGFNFFRAFTDIRRLEEEVNVHKNFYDENLSLINADLAEKAVLALVLAKLCRPDSVEALSIQYRDTLYNDPFYLSRYDPAVEYLLKTDIGTYKEILPPF